MKKILLYLFLSCFWFTAQAETSDSVQVAIASQIDSINATFTFQRGKVILKDGLAEIQVPKGFKFLDEAQSARVITDLWGNPSNEGTIGMLFPEALGPVSDGVWAIDISYSEDGHIKDDDAADINYTSLLKDMQEGIAEENEARAEAGYATVELIGWATQPFYNADAKKLHWAKELKFEGSEANTLNYNIRILGRKGFLMLNAIAGMDKLPEVQENIPLLLGSVEFKEGNRYFDFDPSADQVATYGIGGLIAGKMLAKAGFFALILKFLKPLLILLLKFWKVGLLAIGGLFMALKKWLAMRKENQLALATAPQPAEETLPAEEVQP